MLRLQKAISLLTRTSKPLGRAPFFSFSQNLKKAEKQLLQNIDTEIKYEQEEQEEPSEFEEKFLTANNWQLITHEDSTRMELKKQIDRTTLKVIYHAKLPDSEQNAPEAENQPEGSEQEQNFIEFLVVVDNHNNTHKLILDLAAINGEININGAFSTNEIEGFISNKSALFTTDKYTGPFFESLDEKLQDAMLNYVKDLGINEDLAVFIESSSIAQEQKLYKKWLQDFKEFLE